MSTFIRTDCILKYSASLALFINITAYELFMYFNIFAWSKKTNDTHTNNFKEKKMQYKAIGVNYFIYLHTVNFKVISAWFQ